MIKNTDAVILELADKIGTTGGHLWEALLRQALIYGTIQLLFMAGWVVVLVFAYRFMKKRVLEEEWDPEAILLCWVALFSVTSFVIIRYTLELHVIISAFVNPEYWALQRVLNYLN